jgi:hypothetical protein
MALMSRSFFLTAGVGLAAGLLVVAAVAGPGAMRSGDQTASAVTQVSSGDKVDRRTRGKDATVDAPYTHVETGSRVRVEAPYVDVDVNTDRRRVRVQAPFADVVILDATSKDKAPDAPSGAFSFLLS